MGYNQYGQDHFGSVNDNITPEDTDATPTEPIKRYLTFTLIEGKLSGPRLTENEEFAYTYDTQEQANAIAFVLGQNPNPLYLDPEITSNRKYRLVENTGGENL